MITFRFSAAIILGLAAAACERSREAQEQDFARAAEDYVRTQLKDPASAQFRNVHISEKGFACGEINAKNSYGGYNGFTAFFVNQETGEVFLYDQNQNWRGKGFDARLFLELGCSIGPDENRALEVAKDLEESDRRIEEILE